MEKKALNNYSLIKNDSNKQSKLGASFIIQNHMVEIDNKGFHAM